MAVLIIVLGIIACVMYTVQVVKNKKLEETLSEYIAPKRYIMLKSKTSSHIDTLAQTVKQAHQKAGINIGSTEAIDGITKTVFDNEDELWECEYGARVPYLTENERHGYMHRIFVDCDLPLGAERALIKDLGLCDYMVSFGICTNATEEFYKNEN